MFQQPLFSAFVDLKSAFDSFDRTALWKAMKGIGVPSVILDLIIDLHTATTARVRWAGHLSSPFMTTSGVRKGCVLAHALFCRAMDFIMSHVSQKVGIHVGQHSYTDIDYADDVTLFIDQQDKYPWMKRLRSSVSMFPGAKRRSRILAVGWPRLR